MKNCLQLSDITFLLLLCYFGLAAPADAYFDIGTGAFVVQMVVAFAASVWLSMKTNFIKIDRTFKPKPKAENKEAVSQVKDEPAELESEAS